jgi:UDP-GlcNAc:undecaprenyl-phosphate GlcNAc-1-phosphate transferase
VTAHAFALHLLFGFALFVVAVLLTRFMVQHVRVMDIPNQRSSHIEPTPKGGGVSIVATFLLGTGALFLFSNTIAPMRWRFAGFVVSSLLVALIALYDDVRNRPYIVKMIAQAAAAAIVLGFGIVIDEISVPGLGVFKTHGWAYPLTFLWIIGLSMDGLDGLAGGVAVIVSAWFCVITWSQGSYVVYITSYTILAGALGFLVFNVAPARIFMGDVGSVFLGFVFAVLAVVAMRYDRSHTSLFVMPLLLFNFIYDSAFTFVRRWLHGDRVIDAHRGHLYQLCHRLGYTHRQVSAFHYALCVAQGCAAYWMVSSSSNARTLIYVPFLLFQGVYTVLVIRASTKRGLL